MSLFRPFVSVAALALATVSGVASAQSTTEARLRDQLKQVIVQMRSLQDENAQLRSQVATLTAQAAVAKPQEGAATPEETAKLQADLKAESARADGANRRVEQMEKALAQWKQGYDQAATAYRTRDSDAKRVETDLAAATAHAKTCDANNADLVAIGNELIARYKDKSFGDWMSDREPLAKFGRLRFEELAQEYHVKVVDLAVPPLDTATPASTPVSSANP